MTSDSRPVLAAVSYDFVLLRPLRRRLLLHRLTEFMYAEGVVVVPRMSGMIDAVAGDHIQISPPYVFGETHVEQFVSALEWSFKLSCEISE